MKNVLVTGCCGFIGSNLCDKLIKRKWKVIGIDNLMAGHKKNIKKFENNPNFEFIWADVRDYETIDKIMKKYNIKYVSHQAARGSVPKSVENPILTHDINTNGTINILWASVQNKVENVVCAISSSVYGNTPTLPKKETMEYKPLSPYAITKIAKEMYCINFHKLYGLKTIGLRYFNVYGKKQDLKGDYAAVIPKWITNALNNQDLFINGEEIITRDFTYIDDVVNANILALECTNKEAFGKGYNIGYSDRITIQEVAKNIIDITNSNSQIKIREKRSGDIKDSYADISLARNNLKYNPQTPISIELKKTIEWYKKNE